MPKTRLREKLERDNGHNSGIDNTGLQRKLTRLTRHPVIKSNLCAKCIKSKKIARLVENGYHQGELNIDG